MIIDGNAIAERVYARTLEKVRALPRAPMLAIVTCNPNFETRKYLALKKKKALALGIQAEITELAEGSSTADFVSAIRSVSEKADGVIVQLPLPESVNTDEIVAAIPTEQDVDALSPYFGPALSPVVGAIKEILAVQDINPKDKLVTVIGSGRLVGLPAYRWFQGQGAHVSVVTKDTADIDQYTRTADIVVCGAGVAGLLTPGMVRTGVVILDAGTSEDGGVLRGDANPACAEKASLFTPVPGGIGPITIATLLSNVVDCAVRKQGVV